MTASQHAIPCIIMRGGTSKGPYFMAEDLPSDAALRDQVLLAAMGSPDARQIDGLGGATTLTSKVAIVSPSERPGVDVGHRQQRAKRRKPHGVAAGSELPPQRLDAPGGG